ncbi:MAG TPA: DUF1993 domain-containing protein [Kofleriaceae bacterium]|nr:DUF1993 domain-containing protein [Kofleriaceae bacterium]
MNLYDATVPQLTKMLVNLEKWLDLGVAFAEKKKFDADRLLEFRLAPDMYSLIKQVQAIADGAKFTCAYLAGKQAPSHPDEEKTIAEARARIRVVIQYLETFKREDFEGAADRKIQPRWAAPKWFKGDEYLTQVALPNFYFHVVTAYDILRNIGVDLGKQDFLGSVPLRDPS